MTREELNRQILNRDLDDLLCELLFETTPYVFREDAALFRSWRSRLSKLLQVDTSEVIVTGSAAVGISLSPYKNLKPFDDRSDIDLAIVSDHHFLEAWRFLRGLDLAFSRITPAQHAAVKEHQTRFIYWGTVATDKILPLLPFAASWMPAREEMSGIRPTEGRDINFRVYKDFNALRSYQRIGLKSLRLNILGEGA